MIILILLILLLTNKSSSKFFNNSYLLLFLLLLFSTDFYNTSPKTSKNLYVNPNIPNDNLNYNYNNFHNNCTPYNKDGYLINYNKASPKKPNTNNNTYTCNKYKYYPEKQCYDNIINSTYSNSNPEQCISISTKDTPKPIDTISPKSKLDSKEKAIQSDLSNKDTLIKSPSNSTSISSPINQNINNTPSSLNCIKKTTKLSSNKLNNISQGQSITVVLEGFGLITGNVLSNSNDVLSLKLKNNQTIFINKNFISQYY